MLERNKCLANMFYKKSLITFLKFKKYGKKKKTFRYFSKKKST